MEEEIHGVKAGADIEHIHRMRVASRRLRAILPLFKECFKQKEYRRWIRSVKAVTRALGTARDTDVQIAFLEDFARQHDQGSGSLPGIDGLIAPLRRKRRQEQETVLAAIHDLEQAGTLEGLRSAIRSHGKERAAPAHPRRLYMMAGDRISFLLDDLLAYEPRLLDPADSAGHHAMRIAAKKLRYTLEIYRPLYKDKLRTPIKTLKGIQETLGEIHDCDVWIGLLAEHPAGPGPETAGIAMLLDDRRECRGDLYADLVVRWIDLREKKLFEGLLQTVEGDRPDGPGEN